MGARDDADGFDGGGLIGRGSTNPGHETVGKPVSLKHVYEIAKIKQQVLPLTRRRRYLCKAPYRLLVGRGGGSERTIRGGEEPV